MTLAVLDLAVETTHRLFGEDAIYLPPSGPSVPGLRVLVDRPGEEETIGQTAFVGHSRRIVEVRKAALAQPAAGGRFQLAGGMATIVGSPVTKDRFGLVWTCQCRIAA